MKLRLVSAIALIIGLMTITGTALAGGCVVSASPDPGWLGGPITVSGTGFTANNTVFINLNGVQLSGGTPTDSNGAFTFNGTIPGGVGTGDLNVFVFDGPANCEDNESHTVLASQPTTTTAAPTTTTVATTTTTQPPTTTTTEPPTTTTTEAPAESTTTTTTEPPTTTTTEAPAESTTTTTTEAPAESDGGSNSIVLVLLGALVGAGLVVGGMYLGRRES